MTTASQGSGRFRLGAALRRRMLARVRERRGEAVFPFTLEYRNVYVLPTKFGMGFGLLLVFMALGGLNFNNSMTLLMVFLLAVVTQMTTLLAYRTLSGLRMDAARATPVFAGEDLVFRLHVSNTDGRDRMTLTGALAEGGSVDCIDLPGGETGALLLRVPTERRGWVRLPAFKLESRYPMGLFRAWTWFFPTERGVVYPRPAINPPPLPNLGRGHDGKAERGDGDQVHGLRKYREGDPLRRVAWRTSARHDELFTREMETPMQEACVLDFNRLDGNDTEARLSILTAWVIQADHPQLTYSLNLPGAEGDPGNGSVHRAACLERLALYGL